MLDTSITKIDYKYNNEFNRFKVLYETMADQLQLKFQDSEIKIIEESGDSIDRDEMYLSDADNIMMKQRKICIQMGKSVISRLKDIKNIVSEYNDIPSDFEIDLMYKNRYVIISKLYDGVLKLIDLMITNDISKTYLINLISVALSSFDQSLTNRRIVIDEFTFENILNELKNIINGLIHSLNGLVSHWLDNMEITTDSNEDYHCINLIDRYIRCIDVMIDDLL